MWSVETLLRSLQKKLSEMLLYTQRSCPLYDLLSFSRLEALSSARYKAKSGLSFHVSENRRSLSANFAKSTISE